jgi:hypothetical protein
MHFESESDTVVAAGSQLLCPNQLSVELVLLLAAMPRAYTMPKETPMMRKKVKKIMILLRRRWQRPTC